MGSIDAKFRESTRFEAEYHGSPDPWVNADP